MTDLVKQKTAWPVRKILAVIVAGAVVGGVQSGLNTFWPDHPFADVLENLDVWVQYAVMALAGYLTKEKADVAG